MGVFGGSFDPPHAGHLHAARAARSAFALDEVVLVPAARPPHKPGRSLASGVHRVAMLELLIAGEQGLRLDQRELVRAGPSFTVATLRELRAAGAQELFLILGTDNLAGLGSWREIDSILELAQPIVIQRGGSLEEHLAGLSKDFRPEQVERLRAGFVELPEVEVCSTELRAALREDHEQDPLLPPALRAYIETHGLYREGE